MAQAMADAAAKALKAAEAKSAEGILMAGEDNQPDLRQLP